MNMKELCDIYNNDNRYKHKFLDKIAEMITNLDLYEKVLSLSLLADEDEELYESYEVALMLLVRSLGFKYDGNHIIYKDREEEK